MFRSRVALLSAGFALTLTAGAWADGMEPEKRAHLRVDYDQAAALKLDRSAKTVVVGNASIAEAILVNDKTIYVQGRLFGNTNVVALDENGEEIVNTLITVGAPEIAQVTLYRGPGPANQYNLACAPRCERTITMGDADVDAHVKNGAGKMDVAKGGTEMTTKP